MAGTQANISDDFKSRLLLTTNEANQVLKDLRAERGGFGERG